MKKFKMVEFVTCGAQTRPSYCKFTTNVCCFGCEYNSACMEYAKENKLMRPCGPQHFEVDELCEFAL